jgi:hypothetical protein
LPQVVAVGAGSSTSYAVTEDGEGYAWGFGENLQLTNGEERDEVTPFHICGKQVDDRKLILVGGVVWALGGLSESSRLLLLFFFTIVFCALFNLQAVGGGQHAVFLAQ